MTWSLGDCPPGDDDSQNAPMPTRALATGQDNNETDLRRGKSRTATKAEPTRAEEQVKAAGNRVEEVQAPPKQPCGPVDQRQRLRGVRSPPNADTDGSSPAPELAVEPGTGRGSARSSGKQLTGMQRQSEPTLRLKPTTSISSLPRATSDKAVLNVKRAQSSADIALARDQKTHHAHPRVRSKLSGTGPESAARLNTKKSGGGGSGGGQTGPKQRNFSDSSLEGGAEARPKPAPLSASHGGRGGGHRSLQRVNSPPGKLPPVKTRKGGGGPAGSVEGEGTVELDDVAVRSPRSPTDTSSPVLEGK